MTDDSESSSSSEYTTPIRRFFHGRSRSFPLTDGADPSPCQTTSAPGPGDAASRSAKAFLSISSARATRQASSNASDITNETKNNRPPLLVKRSFYRNRVGHVRKEAHESTRTGDDKGWSCFKYPRDVRVPLSSRRGNHQIITFLFRTDDHLHSRRIPII